MDLFSMAGKALVTDVPTRRLCLKNLNPRTTKLVLEAFFKSRNCNRPVGIIREKLQSRPTQFMSAIVERLGFIKNNSRCFCC